MMHQQPPPSNGQRGYHRVPTDGTEMSASHNDHSANGGDDNLQQSLLLEEQPHYQAATNAPPRHQLYCLVETFLGSWNFIFPYIRGMGNFLYGITIFTMLIVVPMVTYNAIEEHRFDFAAFDSAGVMVLGTLVLSFRLVYLHLGHWYMPEVQKYVVRIVWSGGRADFGWKVVDMSEIRRSVRTPSCEKASVNYVCIIVYIVSRPSSSALLDTTRSSSLSRRRHGRQVRQVVIVHAHDAAAAPAIGMGVRPVVRCDKHQ